MSTDNNQPNMRLRTFISKLYQPPWIILLVCILAYGLMIPWLGLYSDDWILLSTFQKMGAAGLTRYFSTNRPIWGLLFQVTMPLLGKTPWHWHLFGIFWHWAASLSLWWLIKIIWPKQSKLALWAGLLFAVYPGFLLQPISITVGHMLIVYTAFLLSAGFLILAQKDPKKFWLYTLLALFTSTINLLCSEYYFLLHLLQPVMLWFYFQVKTNNPRQRLALVIKAWWPYLLLFFGSLYWRSFFFKYQDFNYQYLFLDRLKQGVSPALIYLFKTMVTDWWNTSVVAWVNIFRLPFQLHGYKIDLLYIGLSLVATLVLFFLLTKSKNDTGSDDPDTEKSTRQIFILGCLALMISGGPFWLTEIKVGLSSFASRFTLPFMLGAILIFTSIIKTIRVPTWGKSVFLAIIIGLSIGYQFQNSNNFRREWTVQKNLLWQLAWRIPNLEPQTIIFMSEMPGSQHITYTIMSAIFDWNFQPNPSLQIMDYAVYYPAEMARKENIVLHVDQTIKVNHIGADFTGNTDQSISVQFSRDNILISSCAHVMSPSIDRRNPFLTIEEQQMAALSKPSLIHSSNVFDTTRLIPAIFGNEPAHDRCYYFEKADLAYQLQDWQIATDLYNQATQLGYVNWMDTELVPFIGSFAHLEEWDLAYSLTQRMANKTDKSLTAVICSLWKSLESDTPDGIIKQETMMSISTTYRCR